jgi:hypothetical protein
MSAFAGQNSDEADDPHTFRENSITGLQLPVVVDAPANAWLNRVRAAENFKAARQARDDATAFVTGLEQRRAITGAQADLLRAAVDRQWFDRIVTLDGLAMLMADLS